MRLLAAFLVAAIAVPPAAAQTISRYDPYTRHVDLRIQLATARHWRPHYDRPDAWKAQLLAESALRPDAVSPVGARGYAQFMPATWIEERRRQGYPSTLSPHSAEAITIGAGYMARIRRMLLTSGLRNEEEIQKHARAGYNSGPGNVLKAIRRCSSETWEHSVICYPGVTGRHAAETIGYVARIDRLIEEINHGKKPGPGTIRRPGSLSGRR